jgi:large subunit ribosomal protein L18e
MMKPNPEDKNLTELIVKLKSDKKAIWKRVSELLDKPRRAKVEVNVSKIARYAKEGITVIVPGKVLGAGGLDKPVVVAAYRFSRTASDSISNAGGKAISIGELYGSSKDKVKDMIIIS